MSAARSYLNTAANTTSAGWQKVPIDASSYDTDSIWDATNDRLIAPSDGIYIFTGRAATSTAGPRYAAVYVNGSLYQQITENTNSACLAVGGSCVLSLTAGDYVELYTYCIVVRSYVTGTTQNYMSIIGPATSASIKSSAYLNTAANTTSAGWQKVPIGTVDFDPSSVFDTTNNRFTPNEAGYYFCTGRVRCGTTGPNRLAWYVNGSLSSQAGGVQNIVSLAVAGSSLVYCNGTTDYIEMWIENTGVDAYSTGLFSTWAQIVGPF